MKSVRPYVSCLGLLCLTLAGCQPKAGPTETPEPTATAPQPLTAEEIADAIDPGPQKALSDALPPWVLAALGVDVPRSATAADLLARSAEAQRDSEERLRAGANDANLVMAVRSMARAVVLAEKAAALGAHDAPTLARLERLYTAIDVPHLLGDRSVFTQMIAMFAQAAQADGAAATGQQMQELADLVQRSVAAAGPLHRRTVAELLRAAPEDAAVPTALLEVASARERGDAWSVQVVALALAQAGDKATAQQQLTAATTCFQALDVACGDKALAAARTLGAEADALRNASEDGERAHRALDLAQDTTADGRIARARAELELERYDEAKAAFEALQAAFPNDARPVAGLAKHAIETAFDFQGAHQLIEGSSAREHADREYYELAIGTRAMAALAAIGPMVVGGQRDEASAALRLFFDRTRKDVDGYATQGSSDAMFLGLILDFGEDLLAQYKATGTVELGDLSPLFQRASDLHTKYPDNPHAYRLLMSLALFERDKARALAAVRAPLPADAAPELKARRVRALCDLAISWSDAALAKQALQESDALASSTTPRDLAVRADTLLTAKRLTGQGEWGAWGLYERIIDEPLDTPDARPINNVGVAAWHVGEKETARNYWSGAIKFGDKHRDVARLNLAVTSASPGDAASLAEVQALARSSEVVGVRVVAHAWLVSWAKGKKAQQDARAALHTAIDEAAKESTRASPPDPYSGVLMEGTLQAGLGYAVKTGLQIQFDSQGVAWAILAPERP